MSRLIVLIDGPSGSGKTTLAARIGWPTIHLDDFYPGWEGLIAGAQMVATDVLRSKRPGFRRWDWELGAPGEWVPVDHGSRLVIEGVGAVTPESLQAARQLGKALTVQACAPESLRRRRAFARDPFYEPYWEMWARQEAQHFSLQRAAGLAFDLTVHAPPAGVARGRV